MVSNLVQNLGSALVYPDAGNFDTNRKLWDNYAAEWEPDARFVNIYLRIFLRTTRVGLDGNINSTVVTDEIGRSALFHHGGVLAE